MNSHQSEPLPGLISAADAITNETQARFGHLTAPQLNWKPGADRWSVAQCFDHLMTANGAYFSIFDKVLSGDKKKTFWERLPILPAVWGKLMIRAVSPAATRKLNAPKIFQPASSNIDEAVIRRFIDQQNQVIRYMQATEGLDLEKTIITSPVTTLITYSLMDTYRIIVAHEQRHFQQAVRVLEADGFPRHSEAVRTSS